MFCKNCGQPLNQETRFCIHCGQEVFAPDQQHTEAVVKPAVKSPKGKYWLFGGVGTAVGALLLAVILFAAGVLSFGGAGAAVGGKIEGPGFSTPEDAAKAYLTGLKEQDMDAMLSAFAVETLVDHYDFEAMLERLKAYTASLEILLPNNNEYHRQLNIESRRNHLVSDIYYQYTCFNAAEEMNDFTPTMLNESGAVSDFVEKFERDTEDYVFADLTIGDTVPPEDLSDMYLSEENLNNIAKQAKVYGVEEDDVTNIAIEFEADGQDWIFCPQAIRYDGKWYLQMLEGNLAVLANMAVTTGGIAPMDELDLP